MADLIGDLGSMLGVNTSLATNSTSRKNNTELNMEDFLQLMIVQLTNQTIDDTMDTNEMMNQMLQMQMITTMANMNDISIQSYANSLVGQLVTVGLVNGNVLEERVIEVKATGTYNGQQIIFGSDGNMYFLNQIMAVGVLPNEDGTYGPQKPGAGGEGEDLEGSGGVDGAEGDGSGEDGGDTQTGDVEGSTGAEGSGESGGTTDPEYDGTQGADTD